MKTAVRKQVNDLPLDEFFSYLAELLKTNPPKPEDAQIVARMAEIGIVPGQDFDRSKLPVLGHKLDPKLALLELVRDHEGARSPSTAGSTGPATPASTGRTTSSGRWSR